MRITLEVKEGKSSLTEIISLNSMHANAHSQKLHQFLTNSFSAFFCKDRHTHIDRLTMV